MQHLGHTRSSYQRDHLIHTPDTFVRAPLPGMRNATAVVHAGPAMGAGFTQYTVELEPEGSFHLGQAQSFVFPVTISLDQTTIDIDGKPTPLAPGMTVTAEIKTDSRRVIDYLLSPLAKLKSEALRER